MLRRIVVLFVVIVLNNMAFSASTRPMLPVIKTAKGIFSNSIYSSKKYDAFLDKFANLKLFLKDKKGKYVNGMPITIGNINFSYRNATGTLGRSILEFTNYQVASSKNRSLFEFSGKCNDGVTFSVKWSFKENQIEYKLSSKDPAGLSFHTSYVGTTMSFQASHKIPPEMEQSKRIKLLKLATISTKEKVFNPKRRKFRLKSYIYPYSQPLKPHGFILNATIKGVYKDRTIKIIPDKKTLTGMATYTSYCPWEGFRVIHSVDNYNSTVIFKLQIL